MFALIRASFNQRRKTLLNGLANAGGFGLSKERLQEVIESCGLQSNVRGETLSLSDFAALANNIVKQ